MAKKVEQPVNHNSFLTLVAVAVLLLAIGQFVLYRNIQHVKKMISETSIEIKEGRGVKDATKKMMEGKMEEKEMMMEKDYMMR